MQNQHNDYDLPASNGFPELFMSVYGHCPMCLDRVLTLNVMLEPSAVYCRKLYYVEITT